MISETAKIYPNVRFGSGCMVEDFVIIGVLPKGHAAGKLLTTIGDHAVIRSHTVIYAGNTIGNNFQTGNKTNIRELNTSGDNVRIGTLSAIEHHVTLGDGVRIHTQVFMPEFSVLEDECWLGPNVVLTNAKFPKAPNVKNELKGACIRMKAIVGANSTLLPGVTIGVHALVGAGSVVTKDVADRDVVAGNPAKVINTIKDLPY